MNEPKPIKKVLLQSSAGERFSVDVGIPIPQISRHWKFGPRSKLKVIECGHSVLFTENKIESLRTICWYLKPKKFVLQEESTGVRVWRVE
jgi:hypothetical protein